MKNFNTFMYNQKLHRERKNFSPYCLQAFSVEEISEDHINDCFKIKQMIQMPKKGEYIRFKKFEREIKSPFIIYADFVSILAPKDNEKQNFEESSTNNCQKHAACGHCYKSVCVDNKFSKCFKSYLGEDDLYILLIV